MANQYAKYDEAACEYYAEIAADSQSAANLRASWYQQGYLHADMGGDWDAQKLPTEAHHQGFADCVRGDKVVFLDGMKPLLYGAQ